VAIVPITLKTVPSAELTPQDLLEVSACSDRLTAEGHDGIVLIQGADTIEETAFALDGVATRTIPIVVSGAMHHTGSSGADGAANLRDAVGTAASSAAKETGVLAVFDGQIHAARFVHKAVTSSVGAFRSTRTGAIGWVTGGSATIAFRPAAALVRLPLSVLGPLPTVACLGDDGELAQMAVDSGCSGLVVTGMGGGHVPPAFADRLERIAERIPVVLTTRVTGGGGLSGTYGFVGSEIDLLRRAGSLPAGCRRRRRACS
jgi:L-asparaginase